MAVSINAQRRNRPCGVAVQLGHSASPSSSLMTAADKLMPEDGFLTQIK
jgi:hypothetical protein